MSVNLSQSIVAIIPAFNEEKTIAYVIRELLPHMRVIVIDDCSSDRTAECARAAGASVLLQAQNSGYSYALNRGFEEACREGSEIMVTCDGDGQHNSADVVRIAQAVRPKEADIVIGERSTRGGIGERLFSWYTSRRYGVNDPLSGLKAYHRSVYESVGHFDASDSIGTELMVTAIRKGFTISRMSITVRERKDTSRFYARRFHANLKVLRALVTLWWKFDVKSILKLYV